MRRSVPIGAAIVVLPSYYHQNAQEDRLGIEHSFLSHFDTAFRYSMIFTGLDILAWKPDGSDLRNTLNTLSTLDTASVTFTAGGEILPMTIIDCTGH